MQIRVIKGSNQIGGCITEITSRKGTKIIIDYGYDLSDDNSKKTFPIEGLTSGTPVYSALFVTHSHEDHIGLVNEVLKDIPVYVEEKSCIIYEIVGAFTSSEPLKRELTPIKFGKTIIVDDDLKVTAYRTDHSAYNSAMFLIEDDQVRVLHMGDYRQNGYSADIFKENLKKIGKVDVLITEGTNITRSNERQLSEQELQARAIEIMQKYEQVFILQSSSNIDRIRSFYEAASAVGKNFVFDISSANILKCIADDSLDYLNKENSTVWVSNSYLAERSKFLELKGKEFLQKYVEPFKKDVKRNNDFVHGGYVMLVKPSMLSDIQNNLARYRGNACLIYSMWKGYIDPERSGTKKAIDFIDKLGSMGIAYEYLHTSGHADYSTLKYVSKTIEARTVIGIHTENNESLKKVFKNYIKIDDGDILEVDEKGVTVVNKSYFMPEEQEENFALRSIDMKLFKDTLYKIRSWTERINTKENRDDIFLGIRNDRLTFYYMGRELFTLYFEGEELWLKTRKRFTGESAKAENLNAKFERIMANIPLENKHTSKVFDATPSLKGDCYYLNSRPIPDGRYSILVIAEYLLKNLKVLVSEYYDCKTGTKATAELPVQNLYLNSFSNPLDDLFIVEMEFTLPKKLKEKIGKPNISGRYDMIGLYKNKLIFIELKVNKSACLEKKSSSKSSGIISHIADMEEFLEEYNKDGLLKKELKTSLKNMIKMRQDLKLINTYYDPETIDFDNPEFWILLDMLDGTQISCIEDIENITGPIEDKPFLKFYEGDIANKKYKQLKRKKK